MAGLDLGQFKKVVQQVLSSLNLHSGIAFDSGTAVNLITGTALVESGLVYLKQLSNGPALGLFQMEPATHNDCWQNYLKFREVIANNVLNLINNTGLTKDSVPNSDLLVTNLAYSIAMCRVRYMRVSMPLPNVTDAKGMAEYHKNWYNTSLGKANCENNIALFQKVIDTPIS